MELRAAWFPALCDGLIRAGHEGLPEADDCFCPFYGDLFRPAGHLGGQVPLDASTLEGTGADEAELLEQIWASAADFDAAVPGPSEFEQTLGRAPRFVERALTALARSKFLADYFPLHFLGDLRQVVRYFDDPALRDKILGRVMSGIGDDTRVAIGHSLGSVVAYEALCARPARVELFLSLGSPLGIRNVVFDKLSPGPDGSAAKGRWPGAVRRWVNIAAAGDIVAAQKTLSPFFAGGVEDELIDSGWDAHSSVRYLNTKAAGEAIASVLRTENPSMQTNE